MRRVDGRHAIHNRHVVVGDLDPSDDGLDDGASLLPGQRVESLAQPLCKIFDACDDQLQLAPFGKDLLEHSELVAGASDARTHTLAAHREFCNIDRTSFVCVDETLQRALV
jgi:hypothetical protein